MATSKKPATTITVPAPTGKRPVTVRVRVEPAKAPKPAPKVAPKSAKKK